MVATTEEEIRSHAVEDGENPEAGDEPALHVIPVGEVRRRLHLSQSEFAAAIQVPLKTVQNREQGRTLPDPAARSLLTIVALAPAIALSVLNPGRDQHWNALAEQMRHRRDRKGVLQAV